MAVKVGLFRKKRQIFVAGLLVAISACFKGPTDEKQALSQRKVVGKLTEVQGSISVRRTDKLVWEPAQEGMELYFDDTIKTEANSTATIDMENRSKLRLRQNTMVVLNTRMQQDQVDQAVLQRGRLKGVAEDQLWLFVSNALIKMRKDQEKAELDVDLSRGAVQDELKVKLKSGQGLVLRKSPQGKREKVVVRKNSVVRLNVPKPAQVNLREVIETKWDDDSQVPERPQPKKIRPPKRVEKPVKLFIVSPPDYFRTEESKITLTGRLSGEGAKVLIEGKKVTIKNRVFRFPVELSPGINAFTIQVLQKNGTVNYVRWNVVKTK